MATNTLGTLLEARRGELGMSLRDLRDASGVSLTTLHRWVHDQSTPDPAHLVAVADALGVERAVLFTAAGYPIPGTGLDTALREAYGVPDAVIARMRAALDAIAAETAGVARDRG